MSTIIVGLAQINNSFADSCYFPYTAGLLQAYCQRYAKNPDKFVFLDFIYSRMPVETAVEQFEDAHIACFSISVWNYRLSMAIAKRLKELNSEVLIVVGGPHIPDKADDFLRANPFVDLACHGEGEKVFLEILENNFSRDWKVVPSISYLQDGLCVTNPKVERIKQLSTVPSPYIEGVFDRLVKDPRDHKWLGLWETNRGCPFSCAYCDWGSASLNRLYTFDMERLEKEIQWFAQNNIEFIFCCDANFGILPRDLDIVKKVAHAKGKYGHPMFLSVQNTKNATERSYAVQKLLHDTGLNKGVNLALQSVDKTTLINVGRKNISLGSFYELQKRFNRDSVETFTDLIIALPGETYESFTNGVSTIIENGQHHRIQFINLSILPNSAMGDQDYQRKHGLIIVETKMINGHGAETGSEERIYETQHLVVGTKTMPVTDWRKTRVFSWMTSLLYFDKLLQIPIVLLHEFYGLNYREIIESFLSSIISRYPVFSDIHSFFVSEAEKIQEGGAEFCKSEEWLNIYWPHDEYVYIKLSVRSELDKFYTEAESILGDMLSEKSLKVKPFLSDAIVLSRHLLKQPFNVRDKTVTLKHNIWEVYRGVLCREKIRLKQENRAYHIDRSTELWSSWDQWFREVIWYGNKKGAYLYRILSDKNIEI